MGESSKRAEKKEASFNMDEIKELADFVDERGSGRFHLAAIQIDRQSIRKSERN